jgi:hypothetical protein
MMVTAYGDEQCRRRAGAAGALQFLTKPVVLDFLKGEPASAPDMGGVYRRRVIAG